MEHIETIIHTDWMMTALAVVVILAITAVVSRIATHAIRKIMSFNKQKNLPASSIFVNLARATIWVLGVCIMLSTCFNVNVSAAIAALGVGGIAISLGAQDTLANLIGGLQLTLFQIVKPGDNITVGTVKGKILDITWRHTRLKNKDGDIIIVPNKMMNTSALVKTDPAGFIEMPVMLSVFDDLDTVAQAIEDVSLHEASQVGTVEEVPHLYFTKIIDDAVVGVLEVKMTKQEYVDDATDRIIRAIAPLTRKETALQDSQDQIEALKDFVTKFESTEKKTARKKVRRTAAEKRQSRSAEWKMLHKLRLSSDHKGHSGQGGRSS